MSIVNSVKDAGGRFLKRRNKKSDEWIEVSDMEARDAISHRLRNQAPQPKVPEPILQDMAASIASFAGTMLSSTTTAGSRKRAKAR